MPVPLFLLTGFLGSGKTTLLARLIRSAAFADTAVIINEFGAVGLDHVLVAPGRESRAVLLDNGCLCCALDDDLQKTLERLFYERERGEIPRFRRIVVESSGLADPAPIINTLLADRLIARHYALAAVITTLDAVLGPRQIDDHAEAAVQLAVADRIILTKTDLATPVQRAEAEARIRAVNPHARLYPAVQGAIAAELVLEPGIPGSGDPGARPPVAASMRPPHDHDHEHDHGPTGHDHAAHDHVTLHGIRARVIHCPGRIAWPRYAAWIRHLQAALGERLLRLKGILALEDGRPHAIHGVQHLFSPPEELAGTVPADLVGTLILITRDADDAVLEGCEARLNILAPDE